MQDEKLEKICPKCAVAVVPTRHSWRGYECPKCGTNLDAEDIPWTKQTKPASPPIGNAGRHPQPEEAVSSLAKRYQDAYLVANTTSSIGSVMKGIGAVLGIAIFAVAVAESNSTQVIVVVLFAGIVIGGFIVMFGVLICALGQLLKATLDTALNTSPLLTNSERTKIMSL